MEFNGWVISLMSIAQINHINIAFQKEKWNKVYFITNLSKLRQSGAARKILGSFECQPTIL